MKTVQVSYSDCEGPLHLDLCRRTVPLNLLFCQDYNFYFQWRNKILGLLIRLYDLLTPLAFYFPLKNKKLETRKQWKEDPFHLSDLLGHQ